MARRSRALEIIMAMDTSGVSAGMRRVSKETGNFGRSATRGAQATNRLRSAFLGAAAAAGGAAAAYVSVAQARAAIETTQELALTTRGLERNLGLATKQASRWAAVTRARGVDSKALTMGFTSLSRAIEGAKEGSETSLKPFQQLGVTQKELTATGGSFSKQVLLVADALGKAEGSSTRQAAAAKLLGRGYQTILPMFTEGAKGLQEQLRWADEFGAVMGKDTVDAMADFTTAQRRGRIAIMGLQIAFAKFATPAITDVIERIGNFAAVLNDPNLSKAAKLTRLREEFGRLQDRVIAIINDLVPIVAQSAGEVGVALAKGIGKGFLETGLLGKAVIGALVVRSFGGVAGIQAAGAAVGSTLGGGINQGILRSSVAEGKDTYRTFSRGTQAVSKTKAAVAGLGVAAGTAGSAMKGLGTQVGIVAAAMLTFQAATDAFKVFGSDAKDLNGYLDQTISRGGTVQAKMGDLANVLGAMPNPFTSITKALGLTDLGKEGKAAEDLKLRLEQIGTADRGRFRSLRTIIRQRMEELGVTERVRKEIEKIIASSNIGRQNAVGDQIEAMNRTIESGALIGGDLNAVVEQQLQRINQTYGRYTPRWTQQVESTLNAQIQATRDAYTVNGRLTDEGMRKIQRIVRRRGNLLASGDATGIARGIANGWKRAGGANNAGIKRFVRRLASMPVAARRQAGATMVAYAKELESKGKLPDGTVARLRSKLIRRFGPQMWSQIRRQAQNGLQGVAKTTEQSGNKFDGMADKAERATGRIKAAIRSLPRPVGNSLGKVNQHFESVGGNIASFNPGKFSAKRKGGLIGLRDEGSYRGSNKMMPVKVAPGELIAYKGRSMVVPGSNDKKDSVAMMLPVGTQVFTYHGQELLARGFTPKQALEKQMPHFNTGGLVKPRITGGTAEGRSVGNQAIEKTRTIAWNRLKEIHKAARKLWVGGPGQMRSYPGLSGDTDFVPALGWMLSALAKATVGNISVTSGYRSYAEQAALFAANPNPRMVAPPGRSNHGRGIAADIAPQRPSYGGREGRFGLSFPMSWEPWHIELSGTPKFPAMSEFIAPGYRKGGWVKTGYTVFDDSGGGYLGHLQQGNGYAELGTATKGGVATGMGYIAQALGIPGELRDKFPLDVKINGRTKRMYKRDRGYGQGTSDYSIDIYKDTWKFFGLNGNSKGTASIRPAATKKQMEEMQGKADDVLGRVRKSRRSGGARGYLKAAKKNAVKARAMAGRGNIWGAKDRLDKARDQIKKANQSRTKKTGGGGPRRLPNLPNLKDLPASVRSLLRSPGLNVDDALLIYDRAATLAEITKTSKDDEAVRRGRIALQSFIVKNSLRTARRRNAFLRTFNKNDEKFGGKTIADLKATARDSSASKEERKAAQRTLAQINKAKSSRSTALSNAASAQSELASLRNRDEAAAEDTSAADLAQAMKDLAAAINEQNRMQASVQAVSSREALKMLSDVISGQIVGKRVATSTPIGVRY